MVLLKWLYLDMVMSISFIDSLILFSIVHSDTIES